MKRIKYEIYKKTMIKLVILVLVLMNFFVINITSKVKGADVSGRKNVLIVHSYNQGFLWTDELHRGITEKLPSGEFNIYTEYLDAYRVAETDPNKIEMIKSYADMDISYIVVTDNPAFDLMMSLKDQYFHDIPVLFAGINGGLPSDMKYKDVRGILQNVDYKEFLIWLNKTFPDIDDLLICGAETETTNGTYDQILEAYNKIGAGNLNFKISIIKIDDYDEQIGVIKSYDKSKTAIYSAGSFGVLDHGQYTNMLSSNTDMPTFCGVSTSISGEVIGGFVVSPHDHGTRLGEYILKLSEGMSIDSVPIIEAPVQQIIFNYYGLIKFNIPESALPVGSVIINKPHNLLVLTYEQVIYIILTFILLVVIISALFFISAIRKKANRELNRVNQELIARKSELEIKSEKLLISQEELTKNNRLLTDSNVKIQYLLDYNQLTGVMNETRFFKLLKEGFPGSSNATILNITLTNLNKLTFTHGKDIYESILTNIADFLRMITKKNALIGLTGNNDFLVATEGIIDEKSEVLTKIESFFEKPFISDLFSIILKYKIGIAYYPQQAHSYELLPKYSSLAITTIIDNPVTNISVYDPSIIDRLFEENLIKNDIEIALAERQFILYYQPKYAMDGITVLGLEALIRWKYKDGTIKSPGYFIDIAEQSGQIINIGFYVIEEACRTIIENNLVEKNIPVAINLSGHHFASMDIVHKLRAAIEKYKIPAGILELEITETTLIRNREFTSAVLKELRDIGFTITLDDFGTGYASLNYIKDLPIDKIKIDQSFVSGIGEIKTRNLIKSMIQMAHELSFDVTVEGIEENEQYEIVRELNPKELQGYLFKRPVPINEIF